MIKQSFVVLSLYLIAGCEVSAIKKVGYSKVLETEINKTCFSNVVKDFQSKYAYKFSVETETQENAVLSYDLILDGQKTSESYGQFTRNSFQLSKDFLAQVTDKCAL